MTDLTKLELTRMGQASSAFACEIEEWKRTFAAHAVVGEGGCFFEDRSNQIF